MGFFETLERKAYNKFKGLFDGRASPPYSDGYMFGVTATIEALKEMMVGEPIKGTTHHYHLMGNPDTAVRYKTFAGGDDILALARGHHGTDGGEIILIVFRCLPKEDK